jgi:sigma-B regulation protein RsbU (phosphoserine phosphatase)
MNITPEFLQSIYGSRILIVDDVALNQMMIEKLLRGHGFYNIAVAGDGQQALDMAKLSPPDIIILDIVMPVMDGFECCRQFRALPRHRDTPILVQTMLTEPDKRLKAFSVGATDIVSKPIDPDELYARVRVHLEKQRYLTELQNYYERTSMELDNARALQSAILPDAHDIATIKQRHSLDVAAHFQPSSEIGGDFWGMKKLFPHQVAFWIVDVSDHGISAALNAFRLQAYLKEYSPHTSNPGEYLTQLNEKLLELLLIGQFATMFYGIIDTQGHRLIYASAGSPHPLILRQATGKVEMVDATGLPLGLSIHHYLTQEVAFTPGDQLLLYSDALTETRDASGDFLEEAYWQQMWEAQGAGTASSLIDALVADFNRHTGGKLTDDLTLCAVKW